MIFITYLHFLLKIGICISKNFPGLLCYIGNAINSFSHAIEKLVPIITLPQSQIDLS